MSNIYNKSILNKGFVLLAVLVLGFALSPVSARADGTYAGYSQPNQTFYQPTSSSGYSIYNGITNEGIFATYLPPSNFGRPNASLYSAPASNTAQGTYVITYNTAGTTTSGYSRPQ